MVSITNEVDNYSFVKSFQNLHLELMVAVQCEERHSSSLKVEKYHRSPLMMWETNLNPTDMAIKKR